MKKGWAALLLLCLLLPWAWAWGEETLCVVDAPQVLEKVPLYDAPGGELLGEYCCYTRLTRLQVEGDWAQVVAGPRTGRGSVTGWMEARYVTPAPNPNSLPDPLFDAVALTNFSLGGYEVAQGEPLTLLGITSGGNFHLSAWRNGRLVGGFAAPAQAALNLERACYGAAARSTPLLASPQAGAPVLMTLHAGCRLTAERLQAGYCPVVTVDGQTGYVATEDLAFSLALSRLEGSCPIVTFQSNATLLQGDRATPLISQGAGVRGVELATDGEWRLVRTWDQSATGWVQASALIYTGETQAENTVSGLPIQAVALVAAPEVSVYGAPGDTYFARAVLPQGSAALVQGVADSFLQLPQGFADQSAFTLMPVIGAETRLYTVTLSEGETLSWNGLTLTAPGAYDGICLNGEAAPPNARPWALGDPLRLSLSERVIEGSGCLMGLHTYVEAMDMSAASYTLTALGGDSWYAVYSLGGELRRRNNFSEGNGVYEAAEVTDFLVFNNCRVEMHPGNG